MQRSLISLGWKCDTAFQLRMHSEENVAHFFDWLVTPISGLFHILENDFNVFYPEGLALQKSHSHPAYVKDLPTGVVFYHQFPTYSGNMQPDFLLHYPVFVKKFKYLAERFRAYMKERPVALVRQHISYEDAVNLEQVITHLYPQSDVRFLYLNQNGESFETPLGRSYIIEQEGSLGIPSEWVKVLTSENLIKQPYRHSTLDIFGSLHHDYNLDTDHRFTDEQIREAIKVNPTKIEFRLELIRWYAVRWLWEKAEAEVLVAVIDAPDNVSLKCMAIQVQLRCGHITASQAARKLVELIDKAQPQSEWLNQLSGYFLEANDAESALCYIRKALEIAPTEWNFYLHLADCLWRLERYGELQYPLEIYQRVHSLPVSYEHFLARAYEVNGNLEAALTAENRFLSQGHRFDALYSKAGILLKLERYHEALENYELARPLAGEFTPILEEMILRIHNMHLTS